MSNPLQNHTKMIALLLNDQKPIEQRATMMMAAFQSGDPLASQALAAELLKRMAHAAPAAQFEELKSKYEQALNELQQGGVRPATFIDEADGEMPGPKPRAHVVTPDGHVRYPFLREGVELNDISSGMTVFLDPQGAIILGHSHSIPKVGPQAKFLRRVPDTEQIEVSIRDETATLYASQDVLDAEANGELKRGDQVLICPQRQFAFKKIPKNKDRRFRFVDQNNIPDVHPGRDIGNPHDCLGWLVRRTRVMLFRDDLREKYDQRRRASLLMIGPSGVGKTLTIKCYLTIARQMFVERTGRDDLESRVIRVKASEYLSEWLGRSDKNFEALFDDIQLLASEKVQTADGEWIDLPVIVIFEEIDGLARRRTDDGADGSGGAMDRIMGTLLQRLDDPTDELANLPLVLISTTNRPTMVDIAMHRRLGAKVARFTRLDRQGLAAVLSKKVKPHYPFAASNGTPREVLRQQLIDEVVGNLYSPANEEVAQIELTLRDGTKLTRFARDFLTGAVIEQAISEAIDHLIFYAEESARDDVGLDSAHVVEAIRRQIDTLADNVSPFNAADYVDIPEHTHVANVRRLHPVGGRLNRMIANRG